MADETRTFTEHLDELRSRLIKSIILVIIMAGIVYNFIKVIMPSLIKPVGKLVFIAPQEAFITNVKIALFGGLFLASPFVLYQIWRVVSAGL